MKTIQEEIIHEIEIKKSRFITHMKYVENEQEAKAYINQISNQHQSATHNCTVYKCGVVTRVDDDGEPGGTAGLPMLEVLNHHDIDYVCCVITRYFGGVKLGAGGLIRAYAKGVSETLKVAKINTLVDGYRLKITTKYNDTRAVEYLFKTQKYQVIETNYELDVNYYLLVDEQEYHQLKQELNEINHLIQIKIEKEIKIVKKEKNE